MGTDGPARVAPERRLHPGPVADLPQDREPRGGAMANVSETGEPSSREERRRKAAAAFFSGLRFRPSESFLSQVDRVAFGGFPEDPEEVENLHPVLRLLKLEKDLAEIRSSQAKKAGTTSQRHPALRCRGRSTSIWLD